jgi:hypothetical protein
VDALERESGAGEWGAWLGVVVGALGWTLSALVLARGGGYFQIVPHLAFVLPLAIVGTVTALAAFDAGRPAVNAVLWLVVIATAGVACNFLVYWFRFGNETWSLLIPLAHPTGIDFRDGLYDPARAFTTLHSGWPPLTLILGKPFTLFGFATAHIIEVVMLVVAAVASVVLSAVLAVRAATAGGDRPDDRRVDALQLGLVGGLWLLTSAGFMYEMERGNIDLFALLFALLAVWLMLRLSHSPWWPALALAVSINLKLYPGVLLVLLLWRYRWRAVIPALATNAVLLLIAGPRNLLDTVSGQAAVEGASRAYWWGNHSAAAIADVLREVTPWTPPWVFWPLLLVPLALWATTMAYLMRRGWSARRAVLAAAACVPVMSVAPGISHDYKLVILVFPLVVLAAAVSTMGGRRTLVWSLLFGLLAWATIMLARSSLVIAPSLQASKYALIVLVQVLLLAVAWQTEGGSKPGGAAEPGHGTGMSGPAEGTT